MVSDALKEIVILQTVLVPVAIIVGAVVVAFFLKRYVFRLLGSFAKGTRTKIDDIVIREIGKVTTLLVYLVAAYFIVKYFGGFPGLEELLIALSVLLAGRALVNIVTEIFKEYIHLLPIEEDQKNALLGTERALKAVLYILVVLVMLASVGIDVWPIITSLGIGGLAISMALKDVLTDYISGIIVVVGRSLKKGDRIIVKDKGVEGVVEEIGWRYTVLRTDEGELVTVPNRVVSSSVIIFKSAEEPQ